MEKDNRNKIVIVDDDDIYRKVIRIQLESKGYHVIPARDGLEGLNMIRKEVPDLIILDLMLPLMDGHKLCRLIKFDKKLRQIPIIILTSRDLDEDAQQTKESGAEAYIIKTTRSEIFLDVVHRLLDRTRKSRYG